MKYISRFMGNQKSALPYTIDEEDDSYQGFARNGWKLYEGSKKEDGTPVSVFKFEKSQNKRNHNKEKLWEIGQNFYKRIKTLRHPHTLCYLDGIEMSDMLIIVTERVMPLQKFIKNSILTEENAGTRNMMIAWGFHCLLKALEFIDNDCNLLHGAVCSESVFVTPGGDFKVGGFFVTDQVDTFNKCPSRIFCENREIISSEYIPPERKSNDFSSMFQYKSAVDVYGLGTILLECFEGKIYENSALTSSSSKVPPLLRKVYGAMISENPSKRPTPQQIHSSAGFSRAFNNKYVKALLFMEEIQLKSEIEKMDFFKKLENDVDDFPAASAFNKILPTLHQIQNFENMTKAKPVDGALEISHSSLILNIVIKICRKAKSEEEMKKVLIPFITTMFSCNDRQTRIILLTNLDLYADLLDKKLLNKEIFPKIIAGFGDSTVALREVTLKSMIPLAPKLTSNNLNEVLLKAVIRLLDDPEPSIVTNSVICFSRVLKHFNEKTVTKVIVGVFPRALKAALPHTRIAGLKAITTSANMLFEDEDGGLSDTDVSNARMCASKLIPAVAFSLLDSSEEVRVEAFKTMKLVVAKLNKISDRMKLAPKPDTSAKGTASAYLSSASKWATNLTAQETDELQEKEKGNSNNSTNHQETITKPMKSLHLKQDSVGKIASVVKNDSWAEEPTTEAAWVDSDEDLFAEESNDTKQETDLLGMDSSPVKRSSGMQLRKHVSSSNQAAFKGKSATSIAKEVLEEDDFFNNF